MISHVFKMVVSSIYIVVHGNLLTSAATQAVHLPKYYSTWLMPFNGTGAVHLRPIQSVFNASARLIVKKRKFDQITATIRDELHWLPVQQRLDYKLCNFIYKCLHHSALLYLSSMCIRVGEIEGHRHLRSAACGHVVVLRTTIKRVDHVVSLSLDHLLGIHFY